jgi:hypothetical protein
MGNLPALNEQLPIDYLRPTLSATETLALVGAAHRCFMDWDRAATLRVILCSVDWNTPKLLLSCPLFCEEPRHRRLAHPEEPAGFRAAFLLGFNKLQDSGFLRRGELWLSAPTASLGAGILQASPGSLSNHSAFEFRQAPEHLHEHSVGRAHGFHMFGEALKLGLGFLDFLQAHNQVFRTLGLTGKRSQGMTARSSGPTRASHGTSLRRTRNRAIRPVTA